jgi:hypothetical protein
MVILRNCISHVSMVSDQAATSSEGQVASREMPLLLAHADAAQRRLKAADPVACSQSKNNSVAGSRL